MDQRMILAPRMIQSMEILQLPIMALQERIEQELQENPVLEQKETANDETTAEPDGDVNASETPEAVEASKDEAAAETSEEFDYLEAFSRDWEERYGEEHRPSRGGIDEEGDKKHDAMQNIPSRPQSLQDFLNEQLSFLECRPEQVRLLRFLITYIDEKGFLTVSTEEIAKSFEEPVSVAQVEEALAQVQKMEPPGVGARDTKECLLLQLTSETPYRDVLRTLILNHLEDIAHNRLPV